MSDMVMAFMGDADAYRIMAQRRVREISGNEEPAMEHYKLALLQCLQEKADDWRAACESAAAASKAVGELRAEVDRLRMTEAEREMLVILRQSMATVVGTAADTKDRKFAIDAIRVIDALLARASGQTSGQDPLGQTQSAPENTPACDAQEPAKQAVTLTDAERDAVASWATQCSAFGLFKIAGFLNAFAERHGRDA